MADAEIRIQNPKTCIWLWGESRAGKSTESRCVPHYLKLGNKWWDGFQGQRRVVLDDLGKEAARALTDKIKLWADPNFNQIGETKGGAILLKYDEFIVTSNYHPYEIWGDTKDYEPIKMRFTISEEMKRDPEFKKDDEEKNAIFLLRTKNKGFE